MIADFNDPLLSVLLDIRKKFPDFRLGQLLGVLTGYTSYENTPNAVVIIEDDELLVAAREFLEATERARLRDHGDFQPVNGVHDRLVASH